MSFPYPSRSWLLLGSLLWLWSALASIAAPAAPPDLVLFSLLRRDLSLNNPPDQKGWSGLQKAVGMTGVGTKSAALLQTTSRSAYDEAALYFLLEMEQPKAATGDSVEIWLGPPGREGPHYQFIIRSDGSHQAYLRAPGTIMPMEIGWQVALSREPNRWSAQVRLPFSALGVAMPPDNVRWRFNISRHWQDKASGAHLSSWAALSSFDQLATFGELAFYSRAEVDADIAYWENNDNDPLLRRTSVSGVEIHLRDQQPPGPASLWSYDPFSVDRTATQAWGCHGLTDAATAQRLGRPRSAQTQYPAFFNAADHINRNLLALARTRLAVEQAERAGYYASQHREALPAKLGKRLQKLQPTLSEIEKRIDATYTGYQAAFDADHDPARLQKIDPPADGAEIALLEQEAGKILQSLQTLVRHHHPWDAPSMVLDANDERRNAGGAPGRYWFSAYRLYGSEPAARYFGPFRSWTIDWPYLLAQRDKEGAFSLPYLHTALDRLASADAKINFQTGFGLVSYQAPTSSWFEAQIAADPDLLAHSQDRLAIPKEPVGSLDVSMRRGVNISHPGTVAYADAYLRHLMKAVGKKHPIDFALTGWEDRTELRIRRDGQLFTRQRGYDATSRKAFQDELKKRYGTLEALRTAWKVTSYHHFSEIEPPDDRFLATNRQATGLTYEWARWQRTSHAEWGRRLRSSIKTAAPDLPVMTDSSHLLMDGAAWEIINREVCDILSFHYNPANEDAMFAYLGSLARRRNLPLACFENYCMMYSRLEGDDERLAARRMRRYFHDLISRDVRMISFWLGYMSHATPYIAAYGGGTFRLDNDQTILRWPSTQIDLFMKEVTAMERPLTKSQPLPGKIAIVVPDSSILQTQYLQGEKSSVPMEALVALQNRVLTEKNLPAEYLHEEMLSESTLAEFDLLLIADAAFIQPGALAHLRNWAALKGKQLLVAGPLGFFNAYGHPLPPEASPLRAAFPLLETESERPWQLAKGSQSGESQWLERSPYGKGEIIRLTRRLQDYWADPEGLEALQSALVEALPNTVQVDDPQIRHQLRRGNRQQTYLLLSNRNLHQASEFTVTLSDHYPNVVDLAVPGAFPLATRSREDRTSFTVRLAPGDWTLLQLQAPSKTAGKIP